MFRHEIFHRLFYSLLPFRVWNHVFLCCRSQYERNMCLFCAKIRLKDKKVIKSMCKTLKVNCFDCMSPLLAEGVIIRGDVSLFLHSSSQDRQKLYNPNNSDTLFYEVISSRFLLWKFHLDALTRLIFNHCGKFILPDLMSGFDTSKCRASTVCTIDNHFGFKNFKLREVVFRHAINLSKRLAVQSSQAVDEFLLRKYFQHIKEV